MSEVLRDRYWQHPTILDNIRQSMAREAPTSTSLADVCKSLSSLISGELEIVGIDNVPQSGPLIVVNNHPIQCDFLLLGSVFDVRSDVRLLAKDSPMIRALPADYFVPLRKNGRHADPDDIAAMQCYLKRGGSLYAIPWGSMDHQARSYATPERAAENVVRYADFASATVLPLRIEVEWTETEQLPLARSRVTIQEPITPQNSMIDEDRIRTVVLGMYNACIPSCPV